MGDYADTIEVRVEIPEAAAHLLWRVALLFGWGAVLRSGRTVRVSGDGRVEDTLDCGPGCTYDLMLTRFKQPVYASRPEDGPMASWQLPVPPNRPPVAVVTTKLELTATCRRHSAVWLIHRLVPGLP